MAATSIDRPDAVESARRRCHPCSGGGIADRLGPKLVAFASAAVLVFVAFEVLITYVGLREAKA